MQLKVEKRYGNGLYLLNSFTWGRTFDLSAGHLETSNGDNSRVNFANPSSDYGRSNNAKPMNKTAAIMYDLPYGKGLRYGSGAPYALNAILGGWQVTLLNNLRRRFATSLL